MPLIALPAHRYERQTWRNGGGSTREVWREGEAPDWRFSLARIEADGPFSSFPGYHRELMYQRGGGLRVFTEGLEPARLESPYALCRFDGAASTLAECVDGPCEVINLMFRPEAVQARLLARPLLGSMLFFPRAGERWLLHLASGQARVREAALIVDLAQGDSALLFGEGGRVLLEGGGELVLVQVRASNAALLD
ncbi:MAG: HutD family protein [Lysobacterales bacterium]|jgi:environmental stress-induced protein Ves